MASSAVELAWQPWGLAQALPQAAQEARPRKINATAAQVLLRWSTQQGVAIIPGATSRQHISESLASSRFTLSPEDVAMLEMAPKPTSFATWSHKGGLLLQEPVVASTTRAARWKWAHYAMPERQLLKKDVILDVGLNIGQDTRNYLAAGHRVIALEANPALAQRVRQGQPFANAIRLNQLLILNKAVTDRGVSTPGVNQSVIFWVNQYDGERSSVSRQKCACSKLPCRYRRCVPVHVPVTTCAELIHEYGVPLYVKVDIEGFDWACVSTIATLAQQTGNAPRFLSAEEMPVRLLRQLYDAGYDSVKCQDQRPFWTQNDPMLKGSGNFGDQVVDMSTQTIIRRRAGGRTESFQVAIKVPRLPKGGRSFEIQDTRTAYPWQLPAKTRFRLGRLGTWWRGSCRAATGTQHGLRLEAEVSSALDSRGRAGPDRQHTGALCAGGSAGGAGRAARREGGSIVPQCERVPGQHVGPRVVSGTGNAQCTARGGSCRRPSCRPRR